MKKILRCKNKERKNFFVHISGSGKKFPTEKSSTIREGMAALNAVVIVIVVIGRASRSDSEGYYP